jgi:hypothetical protein
MARTDRAAAAAFVARRPSVTAVTRLLPVVLVVAAVAVAAVGTVVPVPASRSLRPGPWVPVSGAVTAVVVLGVPSGLVVPVPAVPVAVAAAPAPAALTASTGRRPR